MNKLIKGLAIAAVALGVGSTAGRTDASAKIKYTTTPTSLRGTWYRKATNFRGYDKLVISKYAFKYVFSKQGATSILSGTKPGYKGSNHSDLAVSKRNSHGYYGVGRWATDSGSYWKKVTRRIHGKTYVALKEYAPVPGGSPVISYRYHHKI